MKRCFITICLAVLALSAALAQEKKTVPPPPKRANDGTSLEVTMKFIQDKLNGIGPVSHVVYYHDTAAGDHLDQPAQRPSLECCRISHQMSHHLSLGIGRGREINSGRRPRLLTERHRGSRRETNGARPEESGRSSRPPLVER